MCSNNGKAGLIGEHSMMDGMPMIAFSDHVTKITYADAKKKCGGVDTVTSSGGVEDIFEGCLGCLAVGDSQIPGMIEKGK